MAQAGAGRSCWCAAQAGRWAQPPLGLVAPTSARSTHSAAESGRPPWAPLCRADSRPQAPSLSSIHPSIPTWCPCPALGFLSFLPVCPHGLRPSPSASRSWGPTGPGGPSAGRGVCPGAGVGGWPPSSPVAVVSGPGLSGEGHRAWQSHMGARGTHTAAGPPQRPLPSDTKHPLSPPLHVEASKSDRQNTSSAAVTPRSGQRWRGCLGL